MLIRLSASFLAFVFILFFGLIAQLRAIADETAPAVSPSASPASGRAIPEDPKITALAERWVQHLQSKSAEELRSMTLQDGPVLVVAAGVLSGQGDPLSVHYAGGSPPDNHVPLYVYLYDFHFARSNVREILMIDGAGNVHDIFLVSDHPIPL
jgi:hypothetical protein